MDNSCPWSAPRSANSRQTVIAIASAQVVEMDEHRVRDAALDEPPLFR
jgi:hypothetical protein